MEDHFEDEEDGDSPEFEEVTLTPIGITGRVHNTIAFAEEKINSREYTSDETKIILSRLCKDYPVICDKLIKLIEGEN